MREYKIYAFLRFFEESKYKFSSEFTEAWVTFSFIMACFFEKKDAILNWPNMPSTYRAWASNIEVKCALCRTTEVAGFFREDCFRFYIENQAWTQLFILIRLMLSARDIKERLTDDQIKTLNHIAAMAEKLGRKIYKNLQHLYSQLPGTFVSRDGDDPNMKHNNKIITKLYNDGKLSFVWIDKLNSKKSNKI